MVCVCMCVPAGCSWVSPSLEVGVLMLLQLLPWIAVAPRGLNLDQGLIVPGAV